MPEVSFIIPCLNEERTLGAVISEITAAYSGSLDYEILVCDNGSTDSSRDIAQRMGARVVSVPDRGYGNAIRGGIEAAVGSIGVMGDADCSYTFGEADSLVQAVRDGAALAMGNRFKGGIKPGAMPKLHRYLGNPVLSWLGRILHRTGVGDFHCGLRAFNLTTMRQLGLRSGGMEFASEMVVRTAKNGLRIEERPVTLKPDGRDRPPHLRTWTDGWRHLSFLLTTTGPSALVISAVTTAFAATIMGVSVSVVHALSNGRADLAGPRMLTVFGAIGAIAVSSLFVVQLSRALTDAISDPMRKSSRLRSSFLWSVGLLAFGASVVLLETIRWSSRDFASFSDTLWLTIVGSFVFVVGANGVLLSTLALVLSRRDQW